VTYDPSTGSTGTASTTVGAEPSRAEQVASSAKEQVGNTASVASGEIRNVASEVSTQARDLAGELRTQVGQQASTQKSKLTEMINSFADELQEMASSGGGSGVATELVRQLATRAKSFTSQIDDLEPADLLDQTRNLARRRPGAFLAGALVLGTIAGRITSGAKSASDSQQPSGLQASQYGTTPSLPSAQPSATMTSTYGEPTFEPSTYETGYSTTQPSYTDPSYVDPDAPVTRPYSGGGQL
jgi:Rod binding domain-containing protein